jgi:hypothetical protein
MKTKHRKTLADIFAVPTKANIKFVDIEALVKALGGAVREGDGSRVALELSGSRQYAHRPHPAKEAKKYLVEQLRAWLTELEVKPNESHDL